MELTSAFLESVCGFPQSSIEWANCYLSKCFSNLPSETKEPTADSNLTSLFMQTSVPYDYDNDDAHHSDIPDDGSNDEADGHDAV